MSELKIPEAAYAAGEAGYDESCRLGLRADGPGAAIDAAAPLIVAAELRWLADELDSGLQRTGLLNAADIARTRANELDPQGLTTYYKE
jgi:hypothetical protein